MPRPVRMRRVDRIPSPVSFRPMGVHPRKIEEVALMVEEAEAIRLRDLEGLDQEECAARMYVSRPTFHRILESGRRKVADALTNGKGIRVQGGNYALAQSPYRCSNDGHVWNVPFQARAEGRSLFCPVCASPNVQALPPYRLPSSPAGRRRFRGGRGA
ncbi:MAG: DUF134 domain-containing protein [Chloroflexota bacterium]